MFNRLLSAISGVAGEAKEVLSESCLSPCRLAQYILLRFIPVYTCRGVGFSRQLLQLSSSSSLSSSTSEFLPAKEKEAARGPTPLPLNYHKPKRVAGPELVFSHVRPPVCAFRWQPPQPASRRNMGLRNRPHGLQPAGHRAMGYRASSH